MAGPRIRIIDLTSRRLRWRLQAIGCAGCLVAIFVGGGILGIILFGWRQLLGG